MVENTEGVVPSEMKRLPWNLDGIQGYQPLGSQMRPPDKIAIGAFSSLISLYLEGFWETLENLHWLGKVW